MARYRLALVWVLRLAGAVMFVPAVGSGIGTIAHGSFGETSIAQVEAFLSPFIPLAGIGVVLLALAEILALLVKRN